MKQDSWLDSIVEAFQNLGGEAKYNDLYTEIEKIRTDKGYPLSNTWKNTVRRTIGDNSSSSEHFKNEDIFEWLGSGYWGLKNNYKKSTPNNIGIEESSEEKLYIDGLLKERFISVKIRNAKLILERKIMDNFTCQACGFSHNEKIVECHHLKPLSESDDYFSSIDDLITLCPTCHALAHSILHQSTNFQIANNLIKELRNIMKNK